jgi:hypothetical protein
MPDATTPAASTPESPAEPRAPTRSLARRWWDHSTPVPIVFYGPENGLGAGAGVMSTWAMPRADIDRPSSALLYGVYTTKRQTIVGASHELRFAEDRFVFAQELRYIDWPDRFYGVGNSTSESQREDYTDHYWQLESELQVRLVARLYLGLRSHFRVSETRDLEPDGQLATVRPAGVGRVLWSGVGPLVQWDTRLGLFWPERGNLLRADASFHRPYFGADFAATLYRIDLRHYQPVFRDHVLALRLVAHAASGEPPFQLLPALGGNQLFRGWFLGRLRDRVLAAAEAEYRLPLSVRWALAAFGSLGRVAPRVSKLTDGAVHGAGGAGVRFAVRALGRANFRVDVAYGDAVNVYFQFREAF